jgi:hypothetical protein
MDDWSLRIFGSHIFNSDQGKKCCQTGIAGISRDNLKNHNNVSLS